MNSETSESMSSVNTAMGSGGLNGSGNESTVRRVAQKAHEAVDRLEQTIGSSGEKVMGWQQEYGEMAGKLAGEFGGGVGGGALGGGWDRPKLPGCGYGGAPPPPRRPPDEFLRRTDRST